MAQTSKVLSTFLGISMLTFGVLKFVDPFKTWYHFQITNSALPFPEVSFWAGQLAEILTGVVLLACSSLFKNNKLVFILANISVITMMLVAVYVHLQPDVSADVLPLKIKPPVIPLVFAGLALWNVLRTSRNQDLSR